MNRIAHSFFGLVGLSILAAGCAVDPSESSSSGESDLAGRASIGGSRSGAPSLQITASGAGWRQYQVSGSLLDPESQSLVASNEPIIVAETLAGINASPLSAALKSKVTTSVRALPVDQQPGTFIVRKSIDDQLATATKGQVAAPLLGCSDVDKVYTRQFSDSTPFHWAQGGQSGLFSGNVNLDGTASGNVTASLTLHVSEVWLPFVGCTSYWGHLKNATLTGTGDVVADAKANGSFFAEWHKSATVLEPTLYDDWISIGGIPVKIHVSLPVEAGIDASAKLDVNADAHLSAHGTFNVVCTSSSCDGSKSTTFDFGQNGTPSIGFNARAKVSPWAQASVKVELYGGVADGKIGVRATLASDFWGYYGNTCGDANHDGYNETVEAATLDASVLVDLKADVSFFGADKSWNWNLLNQHVAFIDLLGTSSALTPIFYPESTSGYTAVMRGRMRPCYPYTDTVHFSFAWQDGSPAEIFDSPAATLFTHTHTFREPGPQIRWYAPKATALADYRGRQLNATSTSPTLFEPVLQQ